MANQTFRLTQAALASTLFYLYFPVSLAALDPVPPNTTSTPINNGYNFVASATLTVADGDPIGSTGGVAIDNNNGFPASPFSVDVIFKGDSTVNGTVGPTNPITTIEVQGAGKTVTFAGTVTVGSGNLNFDGAANGATTIVLNNNVNVNGSIDNLSGSSNIGTILFNGNSTVTGTVGASSPVLELDLKGPGAIVSLQDDVQGDINFIVGASNTTTARISDGVTVDGAVNNLTGVSGRGILQWLGGGLITESIGVTNSLAQIKVNTSATPNKTLEMRGNTIIVDTIALTDDGTGTPANGTTLKLNNPNMQLVAPITVSTSNEDTLDIFNALNLTGNIGTFNKAFYLVKVGENTDTTIDGDIYAQTVKFFGKFSLTMGDGFDINGAVDSTKANQGVLNFLGDSIVTGTIGATNSVNQINLQGAGKTVNFQDDINVGSGNLTFASTASPTTTANIGNNVTITGNVDSTNAGNGILAFLGNGTILGQIGPTNGLNDVTINLANSLVTFGGDILNGTSITFMAQATANMVNGITITGDIDGNAPNVGTVQFLGDATVNGVMGPTNGLYTLNILGEGKTVRFNNDVKNATPINFFTNATAVIADGQTIVDVDNKTSAAAGTLIFEGGGEVEDIGATNPLALVSINTLGGAKTLTIHGSDINANIFNVVGAGGTTLVFDNPVDVVNIHTNITTNNNGIDTINFQSANDVVMIGDIGSTTNPFGSVNLILPGQSLKMNGNIYANNTQFQSTSTLELSNNASVFGPITTTVNNQGNIIFLGNSTVGSQIGAPGKAVNAIFVNGLAGSVLNLNANVFTNAFSVNNGEMVVPSNVTLTSAILVNFFKGILKIPTNTTFTINGSLLFATADDTLQIDMGANINSSAKIVTTGSAVVTAPAKLTLLNPAFSPGKTTVFPIVVGGPGSTFVPTINLTNQDTFLTSFDTVVTGNTLNLLITSKPVANFANQSNTVGVGEALDEIALSGQPIDGILAQIVAQLSEMGDVASLNFALSTLAPVVDGALVGEGFLLEREIYDSIAERFDRKDYWRRYKTKNLQTGLASGDSFNDKAAWVKILGYHANQQKRDKVEGYRADTLGLVVGGDRVVLQDTLLGAAFSIASLDVNSKLLPNIKTTADNYQLTVYGSKACENAYFYNGLISLAYNNYTTDRSIQFGNVQAFPRGDYHGWQWGAKGEAGYVLGEGDYHTIPMATLFYSHLNIGSYVEHGAGTASQNISSSDYSAFIASLGIKFTYDFGYDQRLFQLQGYFNALYDFINDSMEITSQFTGGGPSFETLGFRPAKVSYNLGSNFTLFSKTTWSFMLNYDLNFKEDYVANAGYLRALYEW
ncbi:MAG: autotransporter domain-containing protein [Proteobacteria bacterium]|nr:autotransporter domain-containing protein [Pseudomonadota bacterium]